MPWFSSCMPGFMMIDGLFSSFLVLALVVFIVAYFRIVHGRPLSRHMLDERYAKGEISREEYLRCKADLQARR